MVLTSVLWRGQGVAGAAEPGQERQRVFPFGRRSLHDQDGFARGDAAAAEAHSRLLPPLRRQPSHPPHPLLWRPPHQIHQEGRLQGALPSLGALVDYAREGVRHALSSKGEAALAGGCSFRRERRCFGCRFPKHIGGSWAFMRAWLCARHERQVWSVRCCWRRCGLW